jgi:hypothetical protein
MLAAKPVALKSMLIEMRIGFSAEHKFCFALRALHQTSSRNVLLSHSEHHAKQLQGGIPTPIRFGDAYQRKLDDGDGRQNNLTDRAGNK